MKDTVKLAINRRRLTLIAVVSGAVIAAMALLISATVNSVNKQTKQTCFEELEVMTKHLARELYTMANCDHTALAAIGAVIQELDAPSDAELCRIINSFDFGESYISYLELLRPDNTMLDADGAVRDVSGMLDFAEECAAGDHISGIRQSSRDPEVRVIRHAMQIKRDGETEYILYGVIRLNELAEKYTTDLYGGHAYVYVVDGGSGDFILDSWHRSLGNLNDMGTRETLPGYDIERATDDLRRGVGGEIAFVSRTTGNVLYMRYEPTDINNWFVMLTVEDVYAFAKSEAISASLYRMAGICGALFLMYFVFVIMLLLSAYRQVQRLGIEDQSTGLLNRNAFDKYVAERRDRTLPLVTCVFADVNGLHRLNNEQGHAEGDKLLRTAAEALRQEFDYKSTFRIGGDEFVAFSETLDGDICGKKMRRVSAELAKKGYSIAFGIDSRRDAEGLDVLIRRADAAMLNNKVEYYAENAVQDKQRHLGRS